MKKIIFKPLFFLCICISLISCECPNTELTPEEIAQNWNNTPGKITHKEANLLEENYKKFLYLGSRDAIDNGNGQVYMDTREVWFDIEELKNYINYVEQYGKNNDYRNLGMRVYFGSQGPQADGSSRSTVFFYGTGRPNNAKMPISENDNNPNPNLPGVDGLNKGNSGMPPNDLQFP